MNTKTTLTAATAKVGTVVRTPGRGSQRGIITERNGAYCIVVPLRFKNATPRVQAEQSFTFLPFDLELAA